MGLAANPVEQVYFEKCVIEIVSLCNMFRVDNGALYVVSSALYFEKSTERHRQAGLTVITV